LLIIVDLDSQIAAQKKEFLPIDLSGFLIYILDNGSGGLSLKIATNPIII
jgi:hypothetical protein